MKLGDFIKMKIIDWEFTEYLKNKIPSLFTKRNPKDEQSLEYMILKSTYGSLNTYVRDINLKDELFKKYDVGQILTERAFVDASNKIGGDDYFT